MNIYENANSSMDGTRSDIEILEKTAADLAAKSAFRKATGTGAPGGVAWSGDADNEYIFGTSWLDTLSGGAGNDILYGKHGGHIVSTTKGEIYEFIRAMGVYWIKMIIPQDEHQGFGRRG